MFEKGWRRWVEKALLEEAGACLCCQQEGSNKLELCEERGREVRPVPWLPGKPDLKLQVALLSTRLSWAQ